MTVKEAQEVIRKWAGEQAQKGNDDQCWAYDMAQLLLDGVEDHSKEMIEWVKKEVKEADQALESSKAEERWWSGYWDFGNRFLNIFKDKIDHCPYCGKVIDD